MLWEEFGLEGGAASEPPAEASEVIVGVGGGHYCPKVGDVARKAGVHLGHVLASYAVQFTDVTLAEGENMPSAQTARRALEDGGGAHAVSEAIEQTRATYGARIGC